METYQTVDHPKCEPQVGRGLFGIRLFILHFKFQFSKSIMSSIFRIFLNLPYSLTKKFLFPKMSKNRPKIYIKPPNGSYGIKSCLKRDRDIGRKAVLSDVKTAFRCTPALIFFTSFFCFFACFFPFFSYYYVSAYA